MTDDPDSRRANAKCWSSLRRARTSSARVKTRRHPCGAYSVVFIETTIGQILDISCVQISAHISTEDATRYFSEAPEANGRKWAGIPLQPRAEEIALAFVSR